MSAAGSSGQKDAYTRAGVDIEAGNRFVDAIGPMVARTKRPGFSSGIGGFGGIFDLKACGYEDPLLIAATDGIGTKLLLGIDADIIEPLGQDLVAMCVNDLVVQGAEPLFFLDYLATSKLDGARMARLVDGISSALQACNCALIGGETAEMPGIYGPGHFDVAGFALGAVERPSLLPKTNIAAGDQIIAMASSGLHSNGFSLVRKILDDVGLKPGDPAPFEAEKSVGEIFLTPTRLYVRSCLALANAGLVKGFAHITGGGLTENIPRILPENCKARLGPLNLPMAQSWLAETANLSAEEVYRTFNCGIGMVAIVAADDVEAASKILDDLEERHWLAGDIVERDGDLSIKIAAA